LAADSAPEAGEDAVLRKGADKRGHKGRERKCAARGEVRHIDEMIRFVLRPDGAVVPDILGKLPGRGVWVSASPEDIAEALKSGAFSRGFKTKANTPPDLAAQTQKLLAQRLLGLLAMARKSGHIHIGYDQVKAAAGSGKIAWRIEAKDGSEDGRSKIRTLSKAVARELEMPLPRVMGCFDNAQLARAVGRDSVVHMALPPGPLAKSFTALAARYAGFAELIPQGWVDSAHESENIFPARGKSHPKRIPNCAGLTVE
jgi:predicted RNA-binding protein YlxR (DUF448 family)